jgi:pimeloyl-ACP methyl ester carboxylesterase
MKYISQFAIMFGILILSSCSGEDDTTVDDGTDNQDLAETGAFVYEVNRSQGSINMVTFYHIPSGDEENMPVLFVLHGNGRNAAGIRNAWVEEANDKKFIVVAPEFSDADFPGGDGYILGNVFEDGDNPSPSTLNPEEDWAFSVIEPLFDEIKSRTGNTSNTYDIFGFSAGAQFAHRFMLIKPDASVGKIVASAAGWYTVPDASITFPYGIDESPIENVTPASYFSTDFTIQIGTLDSDPNAPALRRNAVVDQQGTNRYDRAFHMYNTSKTITEELSITFNWSIIETQGNAHELEGSIPQASDVLY